MFLGNGSVADTADAITRQDASGHCYGEKTQPNYEGNDCVLRKEHQMSALNKSHAEYEILKQYTFAAWAEETGYQPPSGILALIWRRRWSTRPKILERPTIPIII